MYLTQLLFFKELRHGIQFKRNHLQSNKIFLLEILPSLRAATKIEKNKS